MQNHFGRLARILHWCTDQSMTAELEKMELTASQGHIMGFLAHRDAPPCPRDIEQEFNLSHPTVSGLLSRLEKKGFIEFRPDEKDRRCKRIYVLEKGLELDETMRQTILKTEAQMVEGFSEEEKAQFSALLNRAIDNLGGCPHKRKHTIKEETT